MPQQFTVEYTKERLNLVKNPSFENNAFDGSTLDTTATVISSGAYSGTYALQAVATSTNSNAYYRSPIQGSTIQGSKFYVASVYVKNTAGVTRDMRLSVLQYNSAGSLIATVNGSLVSVTAGGSYQRLVAAFTSQALARSATLSVAYQVSNMSIGNTAVIDALMLEESASADSYFDGYTTNAYWTGAANNSLSALRTTNYVQLENVQQISGSIGRQQLQDSFEPSSMNITARYPTGFSFQNTSLKVDTPIRVKRTGSSYTMWTGRIKNVSVEYDIPYNTVTGVGVADIVSIECEGALAQWGRLQGNGLFVSPSDLLTQLSNVLSGTNIQYGTTYTAATAPLLGSSEVSDSLSNWLNTAVATVGSTVKDGGDDNIVGVYGRDWAGNLPAQFSDTTDDYYNQRYDKIVFDSVDSDFFTEIELNTTDVGDIVVTYRDAPYRTYRQTTFSASASQATDLANYLIGVYGDNGFGISEISCNSEAQANWNLDLGYGWWDIIGYSTFVQFRGITFRCTVLGSSFTATPEGSRFTYYLADIGLTPFLILDNADAGILDYGKLGW